MLSRVLRGLQAGEIAWRPGALELLASLREAGIPCALVSASYRVLLNAAITRLPADTFQVSVAGDEVEAHDHDHDHDVAGDDAEASADEAQADEAPVDEAAAKA